MPRHDDRLPAARLRRMGPMFRRLAAGVMLAASAALPLSPGVRAADTPAAPDEPDRLSKEAERLGRAADDAAEAARAAAEAAADRMQRLWNSLPRYSAPEIDEDGSVIIRRLPDRDAPLEGDTPPDEREGERPDRVPPADGPLLSV
ncbi:hypothetical protein GCM10011505_32870 [Tistrella bauzanensis]|uniref:Uncharacterized protein n=1 Tax=Tistrella bauzanensis TaxID=657419 RepID=A0ABQ1IQ76_9PROT|nr:hypothetical protein [Tistrella bauzanensis]GGB49213.1 hypothetical protein GCM10011505_32870 [Tistrella bauzanensis]